MEKLLKKQEQSTIIDGEGQSIKDGGSSSSIGNDREETGIDEISLHFAKADKIKLNAAHMRQISCDSLKSGGGGEDQGGAPKPEKQVPKAILND